MLKRHAVRRHGMCAHQFIWRGAVKSTRLAIHKQACDPLPPLSGIGLCIDAVNVGDRTIGDPCLLPVQVPKTSLVGSSRGNCASVAASTRLSETKSAYPLSIQHGRSKAADKCSAPVLHYSRKHVVLNKEGESEGITGTRELL